MVSVLAGGVFVCLGRNNSTHPGSVLTITNSLQNSFIDSAVLVKLGKGMQSRVATVFIQSAKMSKKQENPSESMKPQRER